MIWFHQMGRILLSIYLWFCRHQFQGSRIFYADESLQSKQLTIDQTNSAEDLSIKTTSYDTVTPCKLTKINNFALLSRQPLWGEYAPNEFAATINRSSRY